MKVLAKKVAVRVSHSSATQTPSGLYIAPTADAGQVVVGKVTHLGPEVDGIEVGDTVHFNKFGAPEVLVEGTKYYIVPLTEVLVVA